VVVLLQRREGRVWNGRRRYGRAAEGKTPQVLGKPVLRAIDGYVGRHSLVPNAPVLDSTLFPWVSMLEEK
jgi:hypothetical protein